MGGLALLAPATIPPARALLNIDGTRNQIFVFGTASVTHDSNIFSGADGQGDYITSAVIGLELKRKRGIIAINANAKVDFTQFKTFTDLTAWNPTFGMELNKTTGRTTGAFTLSAYRSNRSDSAVNLRVSSWNFPLGLNIKYPINDRLYVTSSTGYLGRKYVDNNALVNYTDYSEGIDVFYTYSSKLDLVGGYRVRVSNAGPDATTYDHSVSFGAVGGLLPKVSGTLRGGYQLRQVTASRETFSQATLSASLGWTPTRKLSFGLQISRDFTTTAVGGTVDTLNGSLSGSYSFSRKLEFSTGIAGGRNLFPGVAGGSRTDWYFSWNAATRYTQSERFGVGLSYSHMINWSSLNFSDFSRSTYAFDVSSRF